MIAFAVRFVTFSLFIVIAWQSARYAAALRASGEVAMTTGLPFYPIVWGIALSFVAAALVLAAELATSVRRARRPG